MRTGVAAVEVDEAFLAKPGALPDAVRRIEFDRRRRKAVLQRGHIDDRLERGAGLTQRLGCPVVARADHVEAALHRQHAAGVDFLGEHSARDFGNRAQRITAAGDLLDDDHHARIEESNARPPTPRLGIAASDADSVPVEPLVKPMVAWVSLFDSTTAFSQSA